MSGTRDSGFGIRLGPERGACDAARGAGHGSTGSTDGSERVVVLCLGNDLLCDDGVGWAVADAVERGLGVESRIPNLESRQVIVRKTPLSGFYLLDELTGFDRAIVVDAVKTGRHDPGTVHSVPLDALRSESGPSPHAAGLPTVIRLGRRCGVPLPDRIHVVAIDVDDVESIGEPLTPAVARAIPVARDAVLEALRACV